MNKTLLPEGFRDVLPSKAAHQQAVCQQLISQFAAYGYDLVSPPMIEQEESLLSGSGTAYGSRAFRFMDPLSNKMLALRADMTGQIARIAASKYSKDDLPLRLSYCGTALRSKADSLHPSRQNTQAGMELFANDSLAADIEMLRVVLYSLSALHVDDICLDFTLPSLSSYILNDPALEPETLDVLRTAIDKKDANDIKTYGGALSERIIALIQPQLKVDDLRNLNLPKEADPLIDRLEGVIDAVSAMDVPCTISIDPLDCSRFAYHTGIGFSVFTKATHQEIGRGGRYVIDDALDAIGFTFYVDELFTAVPNTTKANVKHIDPNTSLTEIQALQDAGYTTVFDLD